MSPREVVCRSISMGTVMLWQSTRRSCFTLKRSTLYGEEANTKHAIRNEFNGIQTFFIEATILGYLASVDQHELEP